MESVNVVEEAAEFPSIEPTAVAKARGAVAIEATANKIAGIVTAASAHQLKYERTKHIFSCREHEFNESVLGKGSNDGAAQLERMESLAKERSTYLATANANMVKINAAIFKGLVKFFAVIAAEIPAKLAESEAAGGGAVEMANALAESLVHEIAEAGEVGDIETKTASDATKKTVREKAVECIAAVNRAAEAVRIAKATTGEEANLNATRVAAAAITVAHIQGCAALAKAAQVEASVRLRQAPSKNNDIIAKRFTETVREYNEQAEEFLVEEEAARAGTASSSSKLSKWYETFVRLHKAQLDSEEAVRVAPLPSGILRYYKAFARLYEAQSEIDRDAALKDVTQMLEMFRACIDDMKERREREVARAAGADDVGPSAVAPA